MLRDCKYNTFGGKKLAFFESDFQLEDEDECLTYLMGESTNRALLDTGASSTVCGKKWLTVFEESLTSAEHQEVKVTPCEKNLRFGDGDAVTAKIQKTLPVTICGQKVTLSVFVVNNDIPLLLSRESMKKMKMKIDNETDKVYALGGEENLVITKSGHMMIPIGRCESSISQTDLVDTAEQHLTFHVSTDSVKCAEHLHKYFAHGSTSKIVQFVKTMQLPNEKEIVNALRKVEGSCDFCKQHKSKEKPHRKVALPMGQKFNDVIAIDLKMLNGGQWILHIIDSVTRYAAAAAIKSKEADEIMTKLFDKWIAIFGRPGIILSDNGGEFNNEKFLEMCAVLNIKVRTTPAESPFCNGTVERHNGLLSEMIEAVLNDTNCNIDIAISWAINAKNSLANVYGFSPHQLVFGRNPEIPGVLQNTDHLPALNDETSSKILADHLNALAAARSSFIKLENTSKLKRVLQERIQDAAWNHKYVSGDQVYYKRTKVKGPWLGPATVVGHLANQVLLKDGGSLIRIHPCKIVLKSSADNQVEQGQEPTKVDNSSQTPTKCRQSGRTNHAAESKVRRVLEEKISSPWSLSEDESDQEGELETCSAGDLESVQDSESESDLEEEPEEHGTVSSVSGNVNQDSDLAREPEDHGTVSSVLENVNQDSETEREPDEIRAESSVSGSMNQSDWESLCQNRSGVGVKKNDIIRFKSSESDEWNNALVIARAGKPKGKNKDLYNVRLDESNGEPVSVELGDPVQVERLKIVPAVEKILFIQEDEEIIFLTSRFPDEEKVKKAKEVELQKFNEYNVFSEVKNIGQKTISCRWVVAEKGELVKARLVARGYEEFLQSRVDAPTVSTVSLRSLLTITASNKWKIQSFDVTSAFLQSEDLERPEQNIMSFIL